MFTSAIRCILSMVTSCGKQGKMSRITLSDRAAIEAGIYGRKTLTEIAKTIHKSPRYISEEIKRNGTKVPGMHPLGKKCRNAGGYRRVGLCGREECLKKCWQCSGSIVCRVGKAPAGCQPRYQHDHQRPLFQFCLCHTGSGISHPAQAGAEAPAKAEHCRLALLQQAAQRTGQQDEHRLPRPHDLAGAGSL